MNLQIHTQSEIGPSIHFKVSCEKCKYFEETEISGGGTEWNSHFENKCLKLNRKFEALKPFVVFIDCPYLNIEKMNMISDSIKEYSNTLV